MPVFTICPSFGKGYKQDLLNQKYGMSVSDARRLKYPSHVEDSRRFFYEVTYNISEFIKIIRITTRDYLLDTKSRHLIINLNESKIFGSNGVTFKNVNLVNYGQCHTFQVEAYVKRHLVRNHFCNLSRYI